MKKNVSCADDESESVYSAVVNQAVESWSVQSVGKKKEIKKLENIKT